MVLVQTPEAALSAASRGVALLSHQIAQLALDYSHTPHAAELHSLRGVLEHECRRLEALEGARRLQSPALPLPPALPTHPAFPPAFPLPPALPTHPALPSALAASPALADDAAHVALNAAALQKVSRRRLDGPLVRVTQGSLRLAPRPPQLDGLHSSDVSFLAEQRGGLHSSDLLHSSDPSYLSEQRRGLHSSDLLHSSDPSYLSEQRRGLHSSDLLHSSDPSYLSEQRRGLRSSDVSYLSERGGETKLRTRVVPMPWERQLALAARPRGAGGALSAREASGPSSRAEAVAAAAKLRHDLAWLEAQRLETEDAKLRAEVALWDEAFEELVRQVAVHCVERGKLLHAVREKHNRLFHRLLELREAEVERVRKAAEHEAEEKRRPSLASSRSATRKAAPSQTEETLRQDLEHASSYRRVLERELTEAREALDAARGEAAAVNLIERLAQLEAAELSAVVEAALHSPQQHCLKHKPLSDQLALLHALLRPLAPKAKRALLVGAVESLSNASRVAAIDAVLRGLSPVEVGSLIAGQFVLPPREPAESAARRAAVAAAVFSMLGGRATLARNAPEFHDALPVKSADIAPLEAANSRMEKRIAQLEEDFTRAKAELQETKDDTSAELAVLGSHLENAHRHVEQAMQTNVELLQVNHAHELRIRSLEHEESKQKARIKQLEMQIDMNARLSDTELRAVNQERDRLEIELQQQIEIADGATEAKQASRTAELTEMLRLQKLEMEATLITLRQQISLREAAAEKRQAELEAEVLASRAVTDGFRAQARELEIELDAARERLEAAARSSAARGEEMARAVAAHGAEAEALARAVEAAREEARSQLEALAAEARARDEEADVTHGPERAVARGFRAQLREAAAEREQLVAQLARVRARLLEEQARGEAAREAHAARVQQLEERLHAPAAEAEAEAEAARGEAACLADATPLPLAFLRPDTLNLHDD